MGFLSALAFHLKVHLPQKIFQYVDAVTSDHVWFLNKDWSFPYVTVIHMFYILFSIASLSLLGLWSLFAIFLSWEKWINNIHWWDTWSLITWVKMHILLGICYDLRKFSRLSNSVLFTRVVVGGLSSIEQLLIGSLDIFFSKARDRLHLDFLKF